VRRDAPRRREALVGRETPMRRKRRGGEKHRCEEKISEEKMICQVTVNEKHRCEEKIR